MSHSKRILVLTSRYPYPVTSGERLRIYELCRQLARHHRLTLLSLCESKTELNSKTPDDGVFARIERVLLPKWRSLISTLATIPTKTPLQIAYYQSREFARKVEELLPQHDCCLAHLIRTGHYVRNVNTPTVLEMTDAISLTYSRSAALRKTNRLMALVYGVEGRRIPIYERAALDQFDLVSLVSDVDRSFLMGNRAKKHVLVCSNGVDTKSLPYRDHKNSEPVIVFVGAMTSAHNLDACLYFATEVLPQVRKHQSWRFRVIGRIKPRHREQLEKIEGTEVLGCVESIADAVGNARVGVAPIRVGAGVKNKILEYMALGLPVISSPVGLEGLHARPGADVLLATEPSQYVAHLRNLWDDGDLVSKLGHNGYQYVVSNHSWQQTVAPLVEAIGELGQGRRLP